jgi:hypothetical protein
VNWDVVGRLSHRVGRADRLSRQRAAGALHRLGHVIDVEAHAPDGLLHPDPMSGLRGPAGEGDRAVRLQHGEAHRGLEQHRREALLGAHSAGLARTKRPVVEWTTATPIVARSNSSSGEGAARPCETRGEISKPGSVHGE